MMRDTELPSLAPPPPTAPETQRGRRIALTIVLVVAFLAAAWVASPLWVGVTLGTVMAFTGQPLYRHLVGRLGEKHRSMAAVSVTLLSALVVASVGTLATYVLTEELFAIIQHVQQRTASGTPADLFGPKVTATMVRLGIHPDELMQKVYGELGQATQRLAGAAAVLLQATTGAFLTGVIALFTMYYVLLDWAKIAFHLETVLPLDPRHTRALMLEFRDVGRSAFVGTVATAVVQGLLSGIGYWIGGVPHPVTWALLTGLASFLPLVGTTLVWGIMSAVLVFTGHPASGIFVLLYGVIIVSGLADYVIRPRLVGGRGQGHPLLTLLALFGGIEVMGLPGLILAPMVMSLFLATLRIYEREMVLERADANAG